MALLRQQALILALAMITRIALLLSLSLSLDSVITAVGVALIAEGMELHILRGHIYVAMAFSFAVQTLNIRLRRRLAPPVQLHRPLSDAGPEG